MIANIQKSLLHSKHIHLVGAGGIGLSRLAFYFLGKGRAVSGSDLQQNEVTDALSANGVKIFFGSAEENLPEHTDLLVYSEAITQEHPERQAAIKRNIPQFSHFEVLGEISRQYFTIAVSGTNGKSTTTAILGLILEAAGMDPSVFVGSIVPAWDSNVRLGKSKYLIVEADEYKRQFLHLHPQIAVITNIEVDHLDYFHDLSDIQNAFKEFLKLLPEQGYVVYNKDDIESRVVGEEARGTQQRGYGKSSDFAKIKKIKAIKEGQLIESQIGKMKLDFTMSLPGEYNVYNAFAAATAAYVLGVDGSIIKSAIENFRGIWRRFETVGRLGKALLISDYAHHPSSITAAIAGAKSFYPRKKILVVFQPHQRHRTKALFYEFAESLASAVPDQLLISEVFEVAGREDESDKFSALDLVETISKRFPNVTFAGSLEKVEDYVRKNSSAYDVIIFMGAGDIYKVPIRLAAE